MRYEILILLCILIDSAESDNPPPLSSGSFTSLLLIPPSLKTDSPPSGKAMPFYRNMQIISCSTTSSVAAYSIRRQERVSLGTSLGLTAPARGSRAATIDEL